MRRLLFGRVVRSSLTASRGDVDGTVVMMHCYMHAGDLVFNLVCDQERCDGALIRFLCLS